MRGLRIAVLAADTLSLLAVLIIRVARPLNPDDGYPPSQVQPQKG
jgi:hypothetical protein